jgi:formylglycine-generating enzyme required for sulfatase activity
MLGSHVQTERLLFRYAVHTRLGTASREARGRTADWRRPVALAVRVSSRSGGPPDNRNFALGFRCLRDAMVP